MTTTGLLHKPTFKLSLSHPSKLHTGKPTLPLRLPASRSVSFGGFGSKKTMSNTMNELIKTSALSHDTEKSMAMFQQEAIVKESSEFMSEHLQHTLNRLCKWAVSAFFLVLVLWRRDAESLWVATGSVLNAYLSATLKQIFKQERPFPTLKSDPGMPSSHAQSIFYTVVFCVLSIIEWLGLSEFTSAITALALAFGSYMSWLRVSQQYHTISQVVVGGAVGSLFSLLWYGSWHSVVHEALVSYLWVRVFVNFASFASCLSIFAFEIRHWINDEQ